MVTFDVEVYDESSPLEGVEVTLGEETEVTDAKGYCIFKNVTPGMYDINFFKEGLEGYISQNDEIKSTPDVQHWSIYLRKKEYLKLSADKTKIKKNETVTIVAQLFKHDYNVTNLKQVSFSINGTQKVISDFDTDKEVAVMTLKGSNQGKVKITAHAQCIVNGRTHNVSSNVLFIQDGHEE